MAAPRDAQVTVVGGGAVGTAVTYMLAREGWTDVQLLEKGDLCAETSSQAAGLVGQARPTVERTRLTMAAADLFRTFEARTGYPTDYREVGALRLALGEASVAELRQIEASAAVAGLPVEMLSLARVRELFPVLEDLDGVRAALWSPTCGYVQPNSLASAYAAAARDLGATVATRAPVSAIGVRDGEVVSVTTPHGTVRTELVVVAAGPWSAALARTVGLDLPIVPVLHEYFVTEPAPGWHPDLPVLRVPEVQLYARAEGSRILAGGFESRGTSLDPQAVGLGDALRPKPDWDVLGHFARAMARFAPAVEDAGVSATFQGWPAFTPDGRFVVGPVSAVRGLAFAAGCNAHGVSGSGGLALHLVEALHGDPSPYVASLSPDRFVPRTWSWEDARRQAQAVYENYYPMPAA